MDDGINWKDLFDSLDNFISKPISGVSESEITGYGLRIFANLPNSKTVSLFLHNNSNYEFEYKISIPDDNREKGLELFDLLLEEGAISTALQNSSVQFIKRNDNPDISLMAVPLTAGSGFIGIIVVEFEAAKSGFDPLFFKFLYTVGSLVTSTLEKNELSEQLYHTKEILEQKVAARTLDLAKSKRELNSIIDTVQTGILVVDTYTEKIVKVNPVAAQMIGDEDTSIINSAFDNFLPIIDTDKADEIDIYNGFESELTTSNNDKVPVLRTISFLRTGSQELRVESILDITKRKNSEIAMQNAYELMELKVMERTEDLTVLVHKLKNEIAERKIAEREIRKMLDREKEISELKTRFVSMVSHEFRTPLTIIRSSAQLIEKYHDKLTIDEQTDYLKRVLKTVDLMTDLIDNVIFIGKPDAGIQKVDVEPYDLVEFCESIIVDLKLSLAQKREIIFNYENLTEECKIDQKLLRLILINLLSNAIKYSSKKTRVEFDLKGLNGSCRFTIRDYGIGIPKKEQQQIFDIFYRGRNVGTISGTGLGMTVVLQSLQILDGKIELESKEGKGTTFKLIFPMAPGHTLE